MIIRTQSAVLQGLLAHKIEVEVDSMQGKPGLTMIGLAEKAVEEAKERITNALSNCQIRLKCKKTIVNLAPADLRKTGSNLELAIAIALWELTIEEQLTQSTDLFLGELALDGQVRSIKGVLPLVNFAQQNGFKRIFLPSLNQEEVRITEKVAIYPVSHLQEVIDFFTQTKKIEKLKTQVYQVQDIVYEVDFADIIGQQMAKRCLEIAAAGGHNLLLCGVPGAGKSLLARALPSILPPLTQEEALELTTIYSVCGKLGQSGLLTTRPCRSPHHTISAIGLAGGSSSLLPGEISLAHQGILFLDELGEFHRDTLEILRQPLETGTITISRASGQVVYPARVTLIAATNPCPCGYCGSKKRICTCSAAEIMRYKKKLSGPIIDRLDLQIFVPEVDLAELTKKQTKVVENSQVMRQRVLRARQRQSQRLECVKCTTNSQLSSAQIRKIIPLSPEAVQLLERAANKWQLSARSYFKLIKVARTIADLSEDEIEIISEAEIAESLRYRQLY